jgi:hypothetical protein
MRFVGRHYGEVRKSKICHGPRDRTDIERISRRNQHHLNAFALGFCEQRMIVERRQAGALVPLIRDATGYMGCDCRLIGLWIVRV